MTTIRFRGVKFSVPSPRNWRGKRVAIMTHYSVKSLSEQQARRQQAQGYYSFVKKFTASDPKYPRSKETIYVVYKSIKKRKK